MPEARQKITLGEMRASGVRGLLIYCSDYHCSHWTAISGDLWTMTSGYPTSSRASRICLTGVAAAVLTEMLHLKPRCLLLLTSATSLGQSSAVFDKLIGSVRAYFRRYVRVGAEVETDLIASLAVP